MATLCSGKRVWLWFEEVWRLGTVEGFAPGTVAIRLSVGNRLIYVKISDVEWRVRFKHPPASPNYLHLLKHGTPFFWFCSSNACTGHANADGSCIDEELLTPLDTDDEPEIGE